MESIRHDSPFARLMLDAQKDEPFTLIDVGCGGAWRARPLCAALTPITRRAAAL